MSVETHVISGRRYSLDLVKKLAVFDIHVLGQTIPLLLATVPGVGRGAPKFDTNNPRIEGEKVSSQREVKELLQESYDADRLSKSIKDNGGQQDPLFMLKNTIIDGNRRYSVLSGEETILVNVFPDDTSDEVVQAFLATKHLSGPKEWPSHVRSRYAYEFAKNYNWPIDKITTHCQFKSNKETEKYIGAYVWLMEAKEIGGDAIKNEDWSKFHHAYVPTMVRHFGYDKLTESFDNMGDTNFEWFVNLIVDGKLTDCRQSDGIVARAIRLMGTPDRSAEDAPTESERLLGKQLLKIMDSDPSKGGGCKAAWEYLNHYNNRNGFLNTLRNTYKESSQITESTSDLAELRESSEGRAAVNMATVLIDELQRFVERMR